VIEAWATRRGFDLRPERWESPLPEFRQDATARARFAEFLLNSMSVSLAPAELPDEGHNRPSTRCAIRRLPRVDPPRSTASGRIHAKLDYIRALQARPELGPGTRERATRNLCNATDRSLTARTRRLPNRSSSSRCGYLRCLTNSRPRSISTGRPTRLDALLRASYPKAGIPMLDAT